MPGTSSNAYLAAGRTEDADTLANTYYQRTLSQPSSWRIEQALWAGWLGQIARARGQVRTAMRWLREAATLADNDTPLPFMPQVLGELAHAAALAGDLDAAQAALECSEAIHGRRDPAVPPVGGIGQAMGGGSPWRTIHRRSTGHGPG